MSGKTGLKKRPPDVDQLEVKLKRDPKNLPDDLFIAEAFTDETLSKLVLDAYAEAPYNVIQLLTHRELEWIEKIDQLSFDKKLYLLCKLGYRFAFMIGKVPAFDALASLNNDHVMMQFLKFCRYGGKMPAAKQFRECGFLIRSDATIIRNLSRLSGELDPELFYLFRDYDRLSQGIEKLQASGYKLDVLPLEISKDIVSKFISKLFAICNRLPKSRFNPHGVNSTNLPYLFYFRANKERFIPLEEVMTYFNMGKSNTALNLDNLLRHGLLQRDRVYMEYQGAKRSYAAYQLTGFGLTILNQIIDDLVNYRP